MLKTQLPDPTTPPTTNTDNRQTHLNKEWKKLTKILLDIEKFRSSIYRVRWNFCHTLIDWSTWTWIEKVKMPKILKSKSNRMVYTDCSLTYSTKQHSYSQWITVVVNTDTDDSFEKNPKSEIQSEIQLNSIEIWIQETT